MFFVETCTRQNVTVNYIAYCPLGLPRQRVSGLYSTVYHGRLELRQFKEGLKKKNAPSPLNICNLSAAASKPLAEVVRMSSRVAINRINLFRKYAPLTWPIAKPQTYISFMLKCRGFTAVCFSLNLRATLLRRCWWIIAR